MKTGAADGSCLEKTQEQRKRGIRMKDERGKIALPKRRWRNGI